MQEEAWHPAAQGNSSFKEALDWKSQEEPAAFWARAGLGSNPLQLLPMQMLPVQARLGADI